MKRRTLLLPTLLAIVVGFSGCTALDHGIVKVEPSTVHYGELITISLIFKSYEPTTVTVSSIDYELYLDGEFSSSGTFTPEWPYWKTGTVPPFQEVVIFEMTIAAAVGSWEMRVVFHTSEGYFPASGGWTVLP